MAESQAAGSPTNPLYQDPTALTDKAIERASAIFDNKIAALREFMTEKVEGSVEIIKTRLDGNDTALVAALQAQKEVATKQTENFTAILDESKKGTTKQIDALNEKIDDLEKRVFEDGGRSSGIGTTVTMAIAVIAVLVSIATAVITLSRPAAVIRSSGSGVMFKPAATYPWDGYWVMTKLRAFFALAFIVAATAVYATCGVPPPQSPCAPASFNPAKPAASGYVLVFSDTFTDSSNVDFNATGSPGKHWYTAKFFGGGNEPSSTFTFGPNGLTINSDLPWDTGNYNLATATPANNAQGWVGSAFGGGAYFEANISFNAANVANRGYLGWPAFWGEAVEWAAQKDADQVPGKPIRYEQYSEDDFFEYDNTGAPLNGWGTGLHHWYGPFGGPCPYGYKAGAPSLCDIINLNNEGSYYNNAVSTFPDSHNVDWSVFHKISQIWVPGTAANGNQGYVQNFIDNQPAHAGPGAFFPLSKVGWTDGTINVDTLQNSPLAFSIIDQDHLVVILGAGPKVSNGVTLPDQQYRVNFVRVWQIPGCGSIAH
jgi:hypothetical protein